MKGIVDWFVATLCVFSCSLCLVCFLGFVVFDGFGIMVYGFGGSVQMCYFYGCLLIIQFLWLLVLIGDIGKDYSSSGGALKTE